MVTANFQTGVQNVLRYPRLDTVMMVEAFIKEHSGEYGISQLWNALPKKMMYQTYKVIIAYLLEINKIAIDTEGKIGFIWDPTYERNKDLKWRPDIRPNRKS